MNSDLLAVLDYMEREKGIKREVLLDAVSSALLTAAKKSVGPARDLRVSIDPKSGEIVGSDIRQQTERVIENIKGILEAAGANLHHVIKTTVFLKDMNDFPAMNEVYGRYFTSAPPARSTVQVSRLPKDTLVEIEVIAAI